MPLKAQRHFPPVATEGSVKVWTSVFDANMRHWAFRTAKSCMSYTPLEFT